MIISFGWNKQRRKNYGSAAIMKCDGCFESGEWSLIEIYNYAHILFLPIYKYDYRYFLVCNNCGKNSFEIFDDQVKVAKETAKTFNAYRQRKITEIELNQIIKQNKNFLSIEIQNESWECPKCNINNQNITYRCKKCGYSVI